ncbi:MAG: class I SAM-dependent methyltransferase [Planctomycetota bacterium]|nr:class I SAM-dependent methyltransferase [Planctomycetota bacterium]
MNGRDDDPAPPAWLDADAPHEEAHSRAQIDALKRWLDPAPKRVLDLGCGAGRVLVPLAAAGHALTGVDWNNEARRRCAARLSEAGADADLIEGDFRREADLPAGPFDAVLCLGNTFMTIVDVEEAVTLLQRVRRRLVPGGAFVIDDCPHDFWPELTEGNWTAGLSEDGAMQLVWDGGDSIFTLRRGEAVNPQDWNIRPGERIFRLWLDGALRLAARAGGLSAPQRLPDTPLLAMRREGG